MESAAQLVIGSVTHELVGVEQINDSTIKVIFAVPISAQPREKFGQLVRGNVKEPVRIGLILGKPEVLVSVVY